MKEKRKVPWGFPSMNTSYMKVNVKEYDFYMR